MGPQLLAVDKDELLTTLGVARRRAILRYLEESPDDVVTVEKLAEELDKQDQDGDRATEVTLVHSDLPKLAAAGVLEFDKRNMTVRYHGGPEVEQLLQFITDL